MERLRGRTGTRRRSGRRKRKSKRRRRRRRKKRNRSPDLSARFDGATAGSPADAGWSQMRRRPSLAPAGVTRIVLRRFEGLTILIVELIIMEVIIITIIVLLPIINNNHILKNKNNSINNNDNPEKSRIMYTLFIS